MAEGMQWFFELQDRISAPARAAAETLKGLWSRLKLVEDETGKVAGRFKDAAGRWREANGEFVKGSRRLSLFGGAFKTAGSFNGFRALGAGLEHIGHLARGAEAVWSTLQSTVIAPIGFIAQSVQFRENTLLGLKVMLGTEEAAKRVFGESQRIAQLTPFETSDVIQQRLELITAGYSEQTSRVVQAAALDIGSILGKDRMEPFIRAMQRIQSQGTLSGEAMQELTESAGLKRAAIYERLAQQAGITGTGLELQRKVERALHQGKIRGSVVQNAIIDVVEKSITGGGPVGSAAVKYSGTLTGVISNVKASFVDLLQSIDFENIPGIKTLKSALSNLAASFAPGTEAGERMRQKISELIDRFGKLFAEWAGPDGFARIEADLSRLLTILDRIVSAAMAVGRFIRGPEGLGEPVRQRDIQSSVEAARTLPPWLRWIYGNAGRREALAATPAPVPALPAAPALPSWAMAPTPGITPPPTIAPAAIAARPHQTAQVHVEVHAGGASAKDAGVIGKVAADAVSDSVNEAFDTMGVRQGRS